MKALKIHGARHITVEDVPIPEPGDGEVRVRVLYGGICGSDLHYYYEGRNGPFEIIEPFTPGHEISGVVDLDPSGRCTPGTAVAIAPASYGKPLPGVEDHPHLWPGGTYIGSASTTPHTQGGMQEYRVVKDFMIRTLPETLAIRDASLAEPLAVALHAVRLAGDIAGQKVLVLGCGPIGLCVVAAALAHDGVQVDASDVLAGPLERACALGATTGYVAGSDDVPAEEYAIVFECSGVAAAIDTALAAVRRTGTVAQVGMLPNAPIGVNLAPLVSKEITFKGCFRFRDEIDDAIALLASRPEITSIITHEVPAERVVEAFAIAKDSQKSGKVVVSLWLDD